MADKWWFVGNPDGGWKSHFFPGGLKDRLLDNLRARGMNFPEHGHPCALCEVDEVTIDAGGSCLKDEPAMEYPLGGVIFKVPVTQAEGCLRAIHELPERMELGSAYYKLHGGWHCVCMRPEDRRELIAQMTAGLPEALALAEIENQRWNDFADKVGRAGVAVIVNKRPTAGANKAKA